LVVQLVHNRSAFDRAIVPCNEGEAVAEFTMAAHPSGMIDDLRRRLDGHLAARCAGYGDAEVLSTTGGSAVVFKVSTPTGPRAFKAFLPDLFTGARSVAERRRLNLQRMLIGHGCRSLVQTYSVEEACGTAFVEMPLITWQPLTRVLASVPDESILPLIGQLVDAVRFLENHSIAHRDIKPENIHVAPDFTELVLLDLGVAREFELPDELDAEGTDQAEARPFLATAQYSSPEYLFRLDPPTKRLWQGLNVYQVGAVLHDMIMKQPLFNAETTAGNRWLIARAVLTKVPSFADDNPGRLSQLKALSARCLGKDIDRRLSVVDWAHFYPPSAAQDPVQQLAERVARWKAPTNIGMSEVERKAVAKRIGDAVRSSLIPLTGTTLPIKLLEDPAGCTFTLILTTWRDCNICCVISFDWTTDPYGTRVLVDLSSQLSAPEATTQSFAPGRHVCDLQVGNNESDAIIAIQASVARAISRALDILDASEEGAASSLAGTDLQAAGAPWCSV
jgi:eukaryotic-like serine/threonine-protein kinase